MNKMHCMMNKLPPHLENPIDNIILQCTEQLLPCLHATGHTPNIITTYSVTSGVLAVWALHQGHIATFLFAMTASYVFDCLDGQLARAYGMTSHVGDVYDHATDTVVLLAVLVVMVKRYRHLPAFGAVAACVGLLLLLSGCHIGNQEAYYRPPGGGDDSKTLSVISCLAGILPIEGSRWFGSGTFWLSLLVCIVILERQLRRIVKVAKS